MTTIGTKLSAGDIMTAEPVCVERTTTLRELARALDEHDISGAPVVDEDECLVGIVSKTDLIRRCLEGTLDIPPAYLFQVLGEQQGMGNDIRSEPLIRVEDLMTEDPVTVTRTTPAGEVARLMFDDRIHRVVVVDAGRRPIGIITSLDLIGTYPRAND